MTPELETKRLLLKPLELADAPQIQALFPHWEIVKYLNAAVPWPYPDDGAEHFVRSIALAEMEQGVSWYWTMRLKTAPDRILGIIALGTNEDQNRGFWMDPAFHRQGLMTEACDAVTGYWFEVLGCAVLRSPKAIANEGSRKISERQGMRVVATREQDFVCGRLPAELWEITAEEWRARKNKKE
jgi:RimJ/RimL family protein N-acetyltransferase